MAREGGKREKLSGDITEGRSAREHRVIGRISHPLATGEKIPHLSGVSHKNQTEDQRLCLHVSMSAPAVID